MYNSMIMVAFPNPIVISECYRGLVPAHVNDLRPYQWFATMSMICDHLPSSTSFTTCDHSSPDCSSSPSTPSSLAIIFYLNTIVQTFATGLFNVYWVQDKSPVWTSWMLTMTPDERVVWDHCIKLYSSRDVLFQCHRAVVPFCWALRPVRSLSTLK